MGAARIGKIRMKAGGAEVRVLHSPKPNPGGESYRGKLLENAKAVASYDEPGSELVGYVLIGLYSDGAVSSGFRFDAERSRVPLNLLPAYVAELIREDMVTRPVARRVAADVVNEANGFDPE